MRMLSLSISSRGGGLSESSSKITGNIITSDQNLTITAFDNFTKSGVIPTLPQLDLVILLRGELGNNMFKIAYGKIIQLYALDEGMFNFTLRFVSEGFIKSESARRDLELCFSKHFSSQQVNLAEWTVNSVEWMDIVTQQSTLLQRYIIEKGRTNITQYLLDFTTIKARSLANIRTHLEELLEILPLMSQQKDLHDTHYGDHFSAIKMHYNLSFPYVIADGWVRPSLLDRYWDELSELFTFTNTDPQCCNISVQPEVEETVLHIRGFHVEIPKHYHNGYRELDPNQISKELLDHLRPGDKVAIISRFDQEQLANYTGVLLERGLQVRFIPPLSGIQGFCFLKSTYKELFGTIRSTYFRMASMLSDVVSNVTTYCILNDVYHCDSRIREAQFTNKKLHRINWHYPIFPKNITE